MSVQGALVRDLRAEVASWFDKGAAGKTATGVADHFSHLVPAKGGRGLKVNDAFALKYVLDRPELSAAYQAAKADAASRALDSEGVPVLAGRLSRVKALLKSKVAEPAALTNALRGTTAAGSEQVQRVVDIPDPEKFSQVLAVSDVHGMKKPLIQLLQNAKVIDADHRWIAGKTLLVVNGDSIDKGSNSLGVVKLWMKLAPQAEAAGGRIVHTLGNHEGELLANPGGDRKAAALVKDLAHQHESMKEFTDPNDATGQYLRSMPLVARVGRWLFVHAGLFPDTSWEGFAAKANKVLGRGDYGDKLVVGSHSVLEAQDWWKSAKTRADLERRLAKQGIFGVVQGHQPDAYDIPHKIGAIDGGRLIKIDTGMAPEAGAHHGYILRFPNPAELKSASYPHVEAIGPAGPPRAVEPRK